MLSRCGAVKKVNWEGPKNRGFKADISQAFLPSFEDPIKPGMVVSAKYRGERVYLQILEEVSPLVFSAEVSGFEFPAQSFHDLAMGDTVEIKREKISWIHFR